MMEWSPAVIEKAEDLVEVEGAVLQDAEQSQVWWVNGSRKYRVQTDGELWITCSCPNGARLGKPRCYHSAAVLMMIERTGDE